MNKKHGLKFYIKLFLIMFKISAFTFGGGLVIVTLMQKEFVEKRNWFTEQEMTDFIAIGQTAPGAIAINASILTGYRIAGLPGTIIFVIAASLPPLIILSVVTVFYRMFIENIHVQNVLKGMQAGISAIIIDAVIKMIHPIIKIPNKAHRILSITMISISFVVVAFLKINIVIILISGAVTGILLFKTQKENS